MRLKIYFIFSRFIIINLTNAFFDNNRWSILINPALINIEKNRVSISLLFIIYENNIYLFVYLLKSFFYNIV